MALTNPISITWGSRTIGGSSSTYQLNGPYVVDKSFGQLRVVAEVIIVSGSVSGLQSASEALEDDFRKRDQDLKITMSGGIWDYKSGDTLLNTTSSITKSGNQDYDRGYSRAYTVVIEGTLPADDEDGLSVLEVTFDYEPSRRRTVAMRGVYTAIDNTPAEQTYLDDFDSRADAILAAATPAGTFELVDETHSRDRNDAECSFTRSYVEILFSQGTTLDEASIVDHRVTFSNQYTYPGEGEENIYRLRRTSCVFEAYLDIREETDLQSVWESTIKDFLVSQFVSSYQPQVFAVEDVRTTFDETAKRMNVSLQFVYQPDGGEEVVESQISVAYRETRNLDLTPVHGQGEYSYIADAGWAIRDRVWSRTVTVVGSQAPRTRIGPPPSGGGSGSGIAGDFPEVAGIPSPDSRHAGGQIENNGWVIVSNTSSTETEWHGDPDLGNTFELTTLSEVVVERFFERPTVSGPITPGGS
jgi:hypothetical protein